MRFTFLAIKSQDSGLYMGLSLVYNYCSVQMVGSDWLVRDEGYYDK
ncbi:MAG: hypothetical protein Ct9H300mP29_8720 [Candidatus Neomarinimicrobiota bacterium]|nr:MAG: hypothetical protein Ct9H300mP29_8720 [Candidatus Neomarinimicrobiota bacterium]